MTTCRSPDPQPLACAAAGVHRRALVAGAAVLAGLAAAPLAPWPAAARRTSTAQPVVFFHLDRLYLDRSGSAPAYIAPAGARGLEPLAGLGEAELRSRHPYL